MKQVLVGSFTVANKKRSHKGDNKVQAEQRSLSADESEGLREDAEKGKNSEREPVMFTGPPQSPMQQRQSSSPTSAFSPLHIVASPMRLATTSQAMTPIKGATPTSVTTPATARSSSTDGSALIRQVSEEAGEDFLVQINFEHFILRLMRLIWSAAHHTVPGGKTDLVSPVGQRSPVLPQSPTSPTAAVRKEKADERKGSSAQRTKKEGFNSFLGVDGRGEKVPVEALNMLITVVTYQCDELETILKVRAKCLLQGCTLIQ